MIRAKPLPDLTPSPGWEAYPARVLVAGCDTYAETWNVKVREDVQMRIRAAKAEADEDVRRRDPIPLDLAEEEWLVQPHGAKGGVVYVLEGAEMLAMFRAFSTEWCLTIRYLSAGIWKCTLPVLRARAAAWVEMIADVVPCEANPRVTRFDFATDVHAPGFDPAYATAGAFVFPQGQAKLQVRSGEDPNGALDNLARMIADASARGPLSAEAVRRMLDGVVRLDTSERVAFAAIGRSQAPQTFTLGRIDGLQVQLYDKCAEIREASGKDWFYRLWGGVKSDVWRVEARFAGGWLKERGVRTYEDVSDQLRPMLSTALTSYRLSDGSASRARRAPVHPLWWRVMENAGRADLGLAALDICTVRPSEFAAMMGKTAVGVTRAALVALHGDLTDEAVAEFAAELVKTEARDPSRAKKVRKLKARHQFIGEPS